MGAGSIEDRVQAIAERVAIDHGLELVHAEVPDLKTSPLFASLLTSQLA